MLFLSYDSLDIVAHTSTHSRTRGSLRSSTPTRAWWLRTCGHVAGCRFVVWTAKIGAAVLMSVHHIIATASLHLLGSPDLI